MAEEIRADIDERIKRKEVFVADAYEYLVDLIINFFRIITRGRELSRHGANALVLGLLTMSLLYGNTQLPKTQASPQGIPKMDVIGVLKLYWVPEIFFLYFIIDALQNLEWVNRLFRRLQQRTDLAYEDIMRDRVSIDGLETLLGAVSFKTEQIREIIRHLRDHNQFTRYAQYNLLSNSDEFNIPINELIQKSLLTEEWEPLGICEYLKLKRFNLHKDFLGKLIDKYKDIPSVLFTIGWQHHFSHIDDNIKKYLQAGSSFRSLGNKLIGYVLLTIFWSTVFAFVIVGVMKMDSPLQSKELVSSFISLLVAVLLIMSYERIRFPTWKIVIKKILKKSNIELTASEFDKFASELGI